jgi:hypothetical protein
MNWMQTVLILVVLLIGLVGCAKLKSISCEQKSEWEKAMDIKTYHKALSRVNNPSKEIYIHHFADGDQWIRESSFIMYAGSKTHLGYTKYKLTKEKKKR